MAAGPDTGVVDEYVDVLELTPDERHAIGDLLRVGHVYLHGARRNTASRRHVAHDLRGILLVSGVGEDNPGPGGGQHLHYGPADAAGPSSDNRNSVQQTLVQRGQSSHQ
jgi:hypothetical protein